MGAEATGPSAVRVAEVGQESGEPEQTAIPWELGGPPGQVAVQLRTTLARVTVGAGLARRPGLLTAVRAIPGLPGVATSPVGGTFVVGGPAWLGLTAVATLPSPVVFPIDWMLGTVAGWLRGFLGPLGVALTLGPVPGAWCPGFSDGQVGGRKLVGLGFRVSRGRIACRGMVAILPMAPRDLEWLAATHRLIDLAVHPERCTSLVECTGDPSWTTSAAIAGLSQAPTSGWAAA
ncbi:MAG TPA: hypothetical protein VMW47_10760 [Verrucomicrobiae bacterium]|nr:hypothetical protein [Verrucomicrobiae bacterium]